ncbi:MAG: fatty-acyl-CoA synthase [Paracoccaceae bacterium]|jgi:fatty-acyl-CoA synthase
MSILNESLAHKIGTMTASGSSAGHTKTGHTNTAPREGHSYVVGDKSVDLRHITIPQMLAETVSRYGPRDALVLPKLGKTLSYYDLDREVDALASGLLALGLKKGDRLGIWSPNRFEWLLTQFATARIGVILVNINPAYRLTELEYALNKVGCKVLILAKEFKTSKYLEMLRSLAPELETCPKGRLISARLPHLKIAVAMTDTPGNGVFSFAEIHTLGGPAQQLRLDAITASLNPDDPINIQFTSGTTGAPKGATLTHFNIVNNARFVTERINLTETDRLCIPVPLYHCFGMVMGTLGCVSKGAAMVLPGEAFDPDEALTAVSAARCTALYGVPTMFVAMLEQAKTKHYDLSSLRTGIMAGALCPIEVMRGVNDNMNMAEVTICYGMTETSPVSFQSYIDDPIEKRTSTVGRIHPHLEVKIIDTDGTIVAVGKQGELCTRGYSVMYGYWDDVEKTAESIDANGWMRTGDLAVLDAQGFCSIVGRLKDMIIRGGENIYPSEVEDFLSGHPSIKEAQVFGIPHEKLGEEVCVWIVPIDGATVTAQDIQQYCTGQIAHYKIPKHTRIVQSFPMTVTGKVQKFVMRDWMIKNAAAERI